MFGEGVDRWKGEQDVSRLDVVMRDSISMKEAQAQKQLLQHHLANHNVHRPERIGLVRNLLSMVLALGPITGNTRHK